MSAWSKKVDARVAGRIVERADLGIRFAVDAHHAGDHGGSGGGAERDCLHIATLPGSAVVVERIASHLGDRPAAMRPEAPQTLRSHRPLGSARLPSARSAALPLCGVIAASAIADDHSSPPCSRPLSSPRTRGASSVTGMPRAAAMSDRSATVKSARRTSFRSSVSWSMPDRAASHLVERPVRASAEATVAATKRCTSVVT